VIAGFVVASVVMMGMETANARIFFPGFAKRAEARDTEVIREFEASTPKGLRRTAARWPCDGVRLYEHFSPMLPPGALLVVSLGWVLGSLAGGFVSTWISQRSPIVHALILGGLLTLAGIANNLMLPPPVWFWVLTVIVFLPATYLGARLALRRGMTVAVPQNNGLQLPAGASPACDQGRPCRAPAPA